MKKILFYLGHPAHFHLFKNTILSVASQNRTVVIKSKDVLETLLKEHGIEFINIDTSSAGRIQKTTATIAFDFAGRTLKLINIIRKTNSYLLAGSAAELTIIGKLMGKKSCIFFEDDFEKVASFAKIAGSFADHLICPNCCSAWKWNSKKIGYNSYHELAYLHPNHFNPDFEKVKNIFDPTRKNFIVRFSQLGAYHDEGKSGITDEFAGKIISMLEQQGRVFITSERKLPPHLEPYRTAVKASDIHHVLYYADMYIGDSQTMTAEAAVLGTPALRFNDFVGELSYLEELEHKYQLTYGIRTNTPDKLLDKIAELLAKPDIKLLWENRKNKMLSENIDFAKFMTWFINEYPASVKTLQQNPDYQYKFH